MNNCLEFSQLASCLDEAGYTLFFFYKNLFYKIYQNFKNMLRTYPKLRVRKRLYFAHLG